MAPGARRIATQGRSGSLQSEDHRNLGPVLQAVFAHDVADVRANGVFGDMEFMRDVLVLHPAGNERHEFLLTSCGGNRFFRVRLHASPPLPEG